PFSHIRRQDRRGVVDGRVDGAVMRLRMTPDMCEKRILAVFLGPTLVLHKRCTLPIGWSECETTSILGVCKTCCRVARASRNLGFLKFRPGCQRIRASHGPGVKESRW